MEPIKRYEAISDGHYIAGHRDEYTDGQYVLYTDHARVVAELTARAARLAAECRATRAIDYAYEPDEYADPQGPMWSEFLRLPRARDDARAAVDANDDLNAMLPPPQSTNNARVRVQHGG